MCGCRLDSLWVCGGSVSCAAEEGDCCTLHPCFSTFTSGLPAEGLTLLPWLPRPGYLLHFCPGNNSKVLFTARPPRKGLGRPWRGSLSGRKQRGLGRTL